MNIRLSSLHHHHHHHHRELYDQAYLDAGCDENRVPLNEENGVDSTVATFATNYVIALVGIAWAVRLFPKQDKEHAGKVVCLYLFSTGVAFAVSGIGHQITEEQEETLNQYLLRLAAVFANVGTFSLIRVVLLYMTKFEGTVRLLWWLCSIVITILGVVFAVDLYIISGLAGLVAVLCALMAHARQWRQTRELALLLKSVSFALLVVGGVVQILLAPLCGYDAYPDCFEDCPLPAPDFNHNALFHVFAMFCYGLYGLGECWLPAQECLSILRSETANGTCFEAPGDEDY